MTGYCAEVKPQRARNVCPVDKWGLSCGQVRRAYARYVFSVQGAILRVQHGDIRMWRNCFSLRSDLESHRDALLLAQGEPDLRSGADTFRSA